MSRSIRGALPELFGLTFGLLFSSCVYAIGWFGDDKGFRQTELTHDEHKQLVIVSGWSNDNPGLMMFEVKNQLSGPVFCTGANFEFKDGKKRSQAFNPKLYIPPNSIRLTAIKGIEKKDVKNFGFSCVCMKTKPTKPCKNVFN